MTKIYESFYQFLSNVYHGQKTIYVDTDIDEVEIILIAVVRDNIYINLIL